METVHLEEGNLGRCKEEEDNARMEFGVGGRRRGMTWYFIGLIRVQEMSRDGMLD